MTFLDEAMLGFAALAAIPIIIHLLNRRNFKIVDWAAIRFLLDSMQRNSRRLQLRDIILLILRTLAIVFVVLAAARPLLSAGSLSSGGAAAVILLDNSMSMTLRRGGSTRFAAAQRAAERIVANLPRGSRAAVITFNTTLQTVARISDDLSYARQAIARARPSDGGTDMQGALARGMRLLLRSHSGGTIYIVSDMQRNAFPAPHSAAWSQWKKLLAKINAAGNQHVVAVKIGRRTPAIISIDQLALSDPLVRAGSSVSVAATVVNHGPVPAHNVAVNLYLGRGDKKLIKVGAAVIARLQHTARVRIAARLPAAGVERIEARLSPQPLPACARRRLVVPVLRRLRVLLVDGGNTGGGAARADGATFINAAVAPGANPRINNNRGTISGTHSLPPLFRVKSIRTGQLGGVSLSRYQAVVFSDVARVRAHWAASLRDFVRHGGALLIFAGPHLQAASYQRVLMAKAGLLPAAPTHIISLTAGRRPGIGLQVSDLSNPIFSYFKAPSHRAFLLQPLFRRAFGVMVAKQTPLAAHAGPGTLSQKPRSAGGAVIARFANGVPAILTRRVGRGTVVLFTTSAGKSWSNFPLCPAFVMLLRRTLAYAVQAAQPQLNGVVGSPAGVAVPARYSTATFAQRGPGGHTRAVPPTVGANGRTTLLLAHARLAGFYHLTHEKLAYTFALNPPAREANLHVLSMAQVRRAFPGVALGVLSGAAARSANGAAGAPLWPMFLALAVVCLLAESGLALLWAPGGRA